MTACELMCWNIGSNVGIQTLKSQEFSIYQHLNLCCALPFHMLTYDFMLQNAVSYFSKCFICIKIVSSVYIRAQILKYWFLCWLLISNVEMLIHMLTFKFIYYNIGEYPEICVQMLTRYKNWTKNSLYLIPLQIKTIEQYSVSARIRSFSGQYFPAFKPIFTPYLSVFSPSARKCGSEKLRIRTLSTQLKKLQKLFQARMYVSIARYNWNEKIFDLLQCVQEKSYKNVSYKNGFFRSSPEKVKNFRENIQWRLFLSKLQTELSENFLK